jgi:hypothetical protein
MCTYLHTAEARKKKQAKPISNKREHQSVMEGGEKEDKVEAAGH